MALRATNYSNGVHLRAATIVIKSTGPRDFTGPCLSRTGKMDDGVHATVLELRVSDITGVKPTRDTVFGETAIASMEGTLLDISYRGKRKGGTRAPEHTHPVRLDLATEGLLA